MTALIIIGPAASGFAEPSEYLPWKARRDDRDIMELAPIMVEVINGRR